MASKEDYYSILQEVCVRLGRVCTGQAAKARLAKQWQQLLPQFFYRSRQNALAGHLLNRTLNGLLGGSGARKVLMDT